MSGKLRPSSVSNSGGGQRISSRRAPERISDPDATRVYYDLSKWTFDQQAELAAAMADAEIPHSWDDTELMVPEESEQVADLVIADLGDLVGQLMR